MSTPAGTKPGQQDEAADEPKWPSRFPNNCPPLHATAASGVVYRFVERDPPTTQDFQSLYETRPAQQYGGKRCQAFGLSVFRDPRDLERLRTRVRAYDTSLVASASLANVHGLLSPTPTRGGSSHHTWWVPLGVRAASVFHVVSAKDERAKEEV